MKLLKKSTNLLIVLIMIISMVITSAVVTPVDAATPKAPAKVTGVKTSNITTNSVKISWNKIAKNKNTKGYAIFRNGKEIKKVNSKQNSFTDTGLKAGTKYTYTVKAYNTYKQKQYYNSKTKKWQTKKPAKKNWKGKKTRKVTKYKFGKVSASVTATTKPLSSPTITSNGNKTIGVNNIYSLNASTNSGGSITYSSSSKEVATVNSSGVVTGKGKGTATITINVKANGIYKACSKTITIKVSNDIKFENASIIPNKTNYNLSEGSTTLTLDSQYGAKWISNDTSIATTTTSGITAPYSNKITFLKAGTVTITAESIKDTTLPKKTITLTIKDDTPSTQTYADFAKSKRNSPPSEIHWYSETAIYKVVLPSDECDVVWTSNNSCVSVYKVSKNEFQLDTGEIGTTTITATLKNAPNGYTGPTQLVYTIDNTGYPREGTTSTGNIYKVERINGNIYVGGIKDNDFRIGNMPSGSTFKVNASQWIDYSNNESM